MKLCMAVLMMLSLLAGPAEAETRTPETGWQAVAEAAAAADTEEKIDAAARLLLEWAQTGETASPQQVADLTQTWQDDPAETAWRYAGVLDAAEALLETGEASAEAYRAAAHVLSPLFTRLLEQDTAPWRQEPSAWPADLADFDGIWCDSRTQELLIFRDGTCRVVIPYLGYYGETAYAARLRSRSEAGYCPSLEVDIHDSGTFQGPLAYYVSGLASDHFWCNTQGQRFDRLRPGA